MFKKIIHFFSPAFFFFIPVFTALAQEGYQLLAPFPTVPSNNPGLIVYLKGLFVVVVGLAIVFAVIMIILGAMEYIMGAVPSMKSDGKSKIMGAIGGLLILLISTIILTTINPDLLRIGLKLDKVGSGGQPPQSPPPPNQPPPNPPPAPGNGKFTYDPGIAAQTKDMSGALSSFLSCMEGKVPAGVGRISSISDSRITPGNQTFAYCAANGCSHTANSCHYGGRNCVGSSYAVDFGDEQNAAALTQAARSCNSGAVIFNEGNHLHVSIGRESGCGCD
jgi:hypothetical protein